LPRSGAPPVWHDQTQGDPGRVVERHATALRSTINEHERTGGVRYAQTTGYRISSLRDIEFVIVNLIGAWHEWPGAANVSSEKPKEPLGKPAGFLTSALCRSYHV